MANIDNVGKNVADKASTVASKTSEAAASKTADTAAKAGEAVTASQGSSASKVPKHQATTNGVEQAGTSLSKNSSAAGDKKDAKQVAKDTFNNVGYNKEAKEDMSDEEKKAYEKERSVKNTEDLINASADVAASSGNGYAKAFGWIHKGLNAATGGKYGHAVGKVTDAANTFAPGAKSIINAAAESGLADAASTALSAKNGGGAEKAGEEAAKKTAEEAGKKTAEKAAEKQAENAAQKAAEKTAENAAKKTADKAGTSVSSFSADDFTLVKFIKSPLFWIIFAVPVFLIVFIIAVVLVNDVVTQNTKKGKCEFPYVQMDYYSDITVKDGDQFFDVPLEDYVAGVIEHEVGGFSDEIEMLKAQAVAARTYAQVMMNYQGYVINSAMNQTYSADPEQVYLDASYATAGLVIVSSVENPTFLWTEYDALAIDESCGGKEDVDNNYVITCQKGVRIPIDWLKSRMIESDYQFFKRSFHGRGMSQWGAYYLVKEEGYTFKQVLELFYDDGVIVSLYPVSCSGGGVCNTTLEITETPESAEQLTENIDDFFKSKGSSLALVNDGLLEAVLAAGPGTRCGVVTAALYTVNKLLEYDARLPYYWGGGSGGYGDCSASSTYGFCPGWGTYSPRYGGTSGDVEYPYTGIDCGRYVTWIFLNGGVSIYDGEYGADYGSGQFVDKPHTTNYDPYSDEYTGQPGDVIVCNGGNHAELILEGDGEGYYIAHASGRASGIKVNYVSYDSLSSNSCEIVDMTWYYENQAIEDFENVYQDNRQG